MFSTEHPIYAFVRNTYAEYKRFVGSIDLPDFQLIPYGISFEKSKSDGYGVLAAHFYDFATDKHTIKVWDELNKPVLNGEYLLFHEFTHLYDTVIYAKADKMKYAKIKGYTEYHAAQIELLKMLGVKSCAENVSFSLNQTIDTMVGQKTVIDYILSAHKAVESVVSKRNFPNSIAEFSTGLGMALNHLGRRTLCKEYAIDYKIFEKELDNTNIESRAFGKDYDFMKSILNDFPSEIMVKLSGDIYLKMFADTVTANGF